MDSSVAPIPPPGPRGRRAWLGALVVLVVATLVIGVVGLKPGSGQPSSAARASGTPGMASSSGAAGASPSAGGSASPGSAAASPSGQSVVLVGAGDIARCDANGDERTAKLVESQPGIVFTLGDNAYPSGSSTSFRDCYDPSWGRFLDRTAFAVAGNHDYYTGGGASFRAYFGRAAVRDGNTWYSADVGAWHVIVLDGNCGEVAGGCGRSSPQVRWLRADLAASDARCTLAMWHEPRFSSGLHGNDRAVAPFWDALYAAGAELVLNGHDHDYERFVPQDPAGRRDEATGITEVVVGTGGGDLRPFVTLSANTAAHASGVYGVAVLTLSADAWDLRFVSTRASITDHATGTCH